MKIASCLEAIKIIAVMGRRKSKHKSSEERSLLEGYISLTDITTFSLEKKYVKNFIYLFIYCKIVNFSKNICVPSYNSPSIQGRVRKAFVTLATSNPKS